MGVSADLRAATDHHIGIQSHVFADHRPCFDRDVRTDHRTRGNLRRRVDGCARVNAGHRLRCCHVDEGLRDAGEISVWIRRDDEVTGTFGRFPPVPSSTRSAALISTAPARVVSTCARYFGLARNASWSGPAWSSGARLLTRCGHRHYFAAEPLDDVLERKCHACCVSCHQSNLSLRGLRTASPSTARPRLQLPDAANAFST